MATDTGGPASEKTLLDEFAGQALVGMRLPWPGDHGVHANFADHAADSAYKVAAAMIAEKRRLEATDHA